MPHTAKRPVGLPPDETSNSSVQLGGEHLEDSVILPGHQWRVREYDHDQINDRRFEVDQAYEAFIAALLAYLDALDNFDQRWTSIEPLAAQGSA